MDTILGACYFMTIAGMGWNLMKIKFQIDLEEEMKKYREYDLSYERIKVGTDKIDPDGNYIVLAKHKAVSAAEQEANTAELREPLFSYTRPCFAPYDPTRYQQVRHHLSLTLSNFSHFFLKGCQALERIQASDPRRLPRFPIRSHFRETKQITLL